MIRLPQKVHRRVNFSDVNVANFQIDPWDASIQKYLSKADALVCKRLQYELTYMSPQEGRIFFNATELQAAGYDSWEEISCQYRCFDRAKGDDVTLQYGQWNELKVGSYDIISPRALIREGLYLENTID